MKRIYLVLLMSLALVVLAACNDEDGYSYVASDHVAQANEEANASDTQTDEKKAEDSTSDNTNDSGNEDKPISLPTINFN